MEFKDFGTKVCHDCGGAKGYFSVSLGCVYPCDACSGYGYVPDYERQLRKGKDAMNYSTAVMLINPNIRAIKTTYEKDPDHGKKVERYIFKTLDPDIKKGDLVVVKTDTRHEHTVVLVDEVDIEIDFDSDIQIKWVVDKVRVADFVNVQSEEGKWIETLKASEKRHKREEIKKKMLEMYKDDGIDKLAIASMSAPSLTIIQQPTE